MEIKCPGLQTLQNSIFYRPHNAYSDEVITHCESCEECQKLVLTIAEGEIASYRHKISEIKIILGAVAQNWQLPNKEHELQRIKAL